MPSMPGILTCLLVMTCLTHTLDAKRIVSIPFPTLSHVKFQTDVARALVERGHQVWIAVPIFILEKKIVDLAGINLISYDTLPDIEESLTTLLNDAYFEKRPDNLLQVLKHSRDIFDLMLKNQSFIRNIEEQNPNLIVLDNVPHFFAMCIIPYKLGIPFAFVGSYYYLPALRVPFSPAEVPIVYTPYSNKMTFIQRLHNTFYYMLLALHNPAFPNDAVSSYAPEMRYLPLDELARQAEIFLVEQDYVLDYPKPTLPNVKLTGGTSTGPAKPLPSKFQSFMDNSKEGVVIVSFGTHVLLLPKHITNKILQVLLQLPMKSVFRSNLTSPDPKKILTAPWIPQNDLLGHPHTKVFVSHCGKNSQYEALYHAVPMVATPLFTDQPYNAERARVKGFTEVLDLNTCTAEQMTSTILTVAKEPRYKQAIVKRSRLFKELYGVPKETAAYWLEHVMEYGGEYMRSAGQQMPLYQFILLDVFLFITFVMSMTFVLFWVLIKVLCTYFCSKRVRKNKA